MRTISTSVVALATSLLLVACGSNDEATAPTDQGTQTMAPAADADNPFAASERQMSDKMMAAVGANVGETWALKMIEHHQGAIAMSRQVLDNNPTADVAKMARDTIDKQTQEIADLRKLVKGGNADQASSEPFRQPMMDMQQEMMAAKGGDISETYMRKMLAHHRGGVAMSDAALQAGVSGAVRTQVTKTRDGQKKDAEMTEAMLRGKPVADAKKATPGARSATPAANASSSAMSASRPRATPKPAPSTNAMSGMKMDPAGSRSGQ